jgi:hypothetical protein
MCTVIINDAWHHCPNANWPVQRMQIDECAASVPGDSIRDDARTRKLPLPTPFATPRLPLPLLLPTLLTPAANGAQRQSPFPS